MKPCPFCGVPPRVIEDDTYGECSVFCVCEAEPCFNGKVGDLDAVRARWNVRADEAKLCEVEAERDQLKHEAAEHIRWVLINACDKHKLKTTEAQLTQVRAALAEDQEHIVTEKFRRTFHGAETGFIVYSPNAVATWFLADRRRAAGFEDTP